MTASFCPHCGYDLSAEETITIGRASFARHGDFTYGGAPLHLTPSERILVETLLRAGGDCVDRIAVLERLGCEARDPGNILHVYATRIRNQLRSVGAPGELIQTVRCRGFRWAVEAEQEMAA
jgi:DNA-binding response OmpR family regulator